MSIGVQATCPSNARSNNRVTISRKCGSLRGSGGQDGGQPSRSWHLSERNGASGEARAECSEPKRGAGGKSARSADPLAPKLEAPPGFEPGMEVLQTSALPLGDGADRMRVLENDEHRIVPDAPGPSKDPSRDHGRPLAGCAGPVV